MPNGFQLRHFSGLGNVVEALGASWVGVEAHWGVLAVFERSWGLLETFLETSWERLGASLACLGGSGRVLGGEQVGQGAPWGVFGAPWGALRGLGAS